MVVIKDLPTVPPPPYSDGIDSPPQNRSREQIPSHNVPVETNQVSVHSEVSHGIASQSPAAVVGSVEDLIDFRPLKPPSFRENRTNEFGGPQLPLEHRTTIPMSHPTGLQCQSSPVRDAHGSYSGPDAACQATPDSHPSDHNFGFLQKSPIAGFLPSLGNKQKKFEEVYIAVMGVTGAGKSSFISLCIDQKVEIGLTLASCTKEVGHFAFEWNRKIRVHLIDTPGFDDQTRSDTEVLKDIAGWLAITYEKNIRLSGLIYLHRITDPRMGGSQMRNLAMFKQLCGKNCFPAVVLVTTFWGCIDPRIGADHERELISNDEYWGYMKKHGSMVVRHTGDKDSALDIIDEIVQRHRTVVPCLQDEMSRKGLDLEETSAGRSLNKELIEQREKDKKAMEQLESDMRQAIHDKDEELMQVTIQLQDKFQQKIDTGNKSICDLKASLDSLKEEKEKEFKEIKKNLETQANILARKDKEFQKYQSSHPYDLAEKERNDIEREAMKAQISALVDKAESKKPGFWNTFWDELGKELQDFWDQL